MLPPVEGVVSPVCYLSLKGAPTWLYICSQVGLHELALYSKLCLLGLRLGLQVGLRLGRIGYANGGVPEGYAHVSSPRVSGRFEESGRDSK